MTFSIFPMKTPNSFIIQEALNIIYNSDFNNACLITGGIGDTIALDSYLHNKDFDTLFYANGDSEEVCNLFSFLPEYKNKKHIKLWNNVRDRRGIQQQFLDVMPKNIVNFSMQDIFPLVLNRKIKYNYSSFLNYKLTDMSNFDLPEKYICLGGHSNNLDHAGKRRNFDQEDWNVVLKFLKYKNIKGVSISKNNLVVPDDVVNLNNQTTVLESLEILKNSIGFIGIDSYLAILAAKLNFEIFFVKTLSPWTIKNKSVYYAPLTNFEFLLPRMKDICKICKIKIL